MTHDEAFALSPIKVGETYIFDYPVEFTSLDDYTEHRGQQVVVVRPCREDEADILWDKISATDEEEQIMDRMFVVRASDGWEGHAWESELVKIA